MAPAGKQKRRICVVTGSRADYGHLRGIMQEIERDPRLHLQVVATGMHCSRRFGWTYRELERDGFGMNCKLPILGEKDSAHETTKSIGKGCRLFADAFARLKPDVVVILGDRFEILAAAIAAYVAKIPIAHVHGGELSAGAIDEGIRHSITKMASIHFAATEDYRKRIIQLGEDPRRVFNYGAPGLEAIEELALLSRKELAASLNFDLERPVALVTYHPETLASISTEAQIKTLLNALGTFDVRAIFTEANADPEGRKINRRVREFCLRTYLKYRFYNNLGRLRYLSCLQHFDLMIGNSSSGIIEAPSFELPVVNIGDRQQGRIRARNVIDVPCRESAIRNGIRLALSEPFRASLRGMKNPYGGASNGRVSARIKEKLRTLKTNGALIKKQFHDISFGCSGAEVQL